MDLAPVHLRLEDEHVVAAVHSSDLPHVVEVLEHTRHAAHDRGGDRLARVRPERYRAREHHVVGEQLLDRRHVACLHSLPERMHDLTSAQLVD